MSFRFHRDPALRRHACRRSIAPLSKIERGVCDKGERWLCAAISIGRLVECVAYSLSRALLGAPSSLYRCVLRRRSNRALFLTSGLWDTMAGSCSPLHRNGQMAYGDHLITTIEQ